MSILLIEDELKTLAYLSKGLSESGFQVDVAHDGAQGAHRIHTSEYDLIVLDVMLPERDGWTLLGEMRAAGNDTPVLFLTARDSVQDRVKGLELGADDYLIKPFAFSELLARIRSILRRSTTRPLERLRIADLDIDVARAQASRAGRRLDLTSRQFSLLCLLARHGGEVLSRKFLSEQVWDIRFETDTNIIDVAIRRLRNKVDDPFALKLIHTIRGVGYLLEQRQGSLESTHK